MKKLMLAIAGAVALVSATFADNWFQPAIGSYTEFPPTAQEQITADGGTWSNTDGATLVAGASAKELEVAAATETPLTFTGASTLSIDDYTLEFNTTVEFTPFESSASLPDATNMKGGVVAKKGGNFWVLAKGEGDANEWQDSGVATASGPVTVKVAIGKKDSAYQIVYTINGTVLDAKPYYLGAEGANKSLSAVHYAGDGVVSVLAATSESLNEAEMGGTKYATLSDAINAAGDGATIKILANVKTGVTVAKGKSITLDLNNHAIETSSATLFNYGTLTLKNGTIISTGKQAIYNYGTLTIEGGTYNSVESTIVMMGNSTTTINGGTFTATDNAVLAGQGLEANSNVVLTVNGGTFNGGITTAGYIACGLYVANSGTYTLNGGTFNITNGCGVCARAGTTKISDDVTINLFDPGEAGWVGDKKSTVPCVAAYFDWTIPPYPGYAAGDTIKSQVKFEAADGQVWFEPPDADGFYALGKTEDAKAKIGTTYYLTLQDAVNAGGDVVLLTDSAETITVAADKTVYLDLGGKTLTPTGNFGVINNGTLTLTNGTIVAKYPIRPGDNSSTTINGGTYTSVEGAITVRCADSTVIINDGIFTASDNAVLSSNGNAGMSGNTITVNGGTFTSSIVTAGYIACGVYAPNADTWNLNGGTFIVNGGVGVLARAGIVNINGATFNVTAPAAAGWVGDTKVQIDGAVVAFDNTSSYPGYADTAKIEVTDLTTGEGKLNNAALYGEATIINKAGAKLAAPKGYQWDENGKLVKKAGTVILISGETQTDYQTLPEAFDAAKGLKNVTIKLLADAYMTAKYEIRNFNGTFDLGGFSVTNDASWVLSTYDWMFDIYGNTEMTITNGTIYLDERMIYVRLGAEVTLASDATINAISTARTANTVRVFGGTLNVYGTMNLIKAYEAGAIFDVPISNSVINVYEGANLYANGGWGYKVGGDSSTAPKLTVYGGTFTINSGYPVFNCYSGNYATIDIKGGTFKRDEGFNTSLIALGDDKHMTVVPLTDACTAKFKNMTGVASWCAEGYAPIKGEDGFYTIGVPAAKAGTEFYLTLQDAANAGGDVVLLKDVTLTARIDTEKDATFNLNGKTITPTADCGNHSAFNVKAGTVTITNGVIDATAIAESAGETDAITVRSGATVNLGDDLTIKINSKNGACVYAFAGGYANISAGTYINNTTETYQYNPEFMAMLVNQANNTDQLISITGGSFKGQNPAAGDDSGEPSTFLAEGYYSWKQDDGSWLVNDTVPGAKIGNVLYLTLADAINAAVDGDTVTLLANVTDGVGIQVAQDKFGTDGLTVDFGDFTYTATKDPVGSTGTENQVFQLLKGNKVTFKNGTIAVAEASKELFRFIVQNYSSLTLTGMTLDGTNLGKPNKTPYTLSNCCGTTTISAGTTIIAAANGFAFDVDNGGNPTAYPDGAIVTVDGATITGNIGLGRDGSLTLTSGTLNGNLVKDASGDIAVTVTKADTFVAAAPEGYCWDANGNMVKGKAKIGTTYYLTLQDAFNAVPTEGAEETTKVVLVENTAESSITIVAGQKVDLDLGGKKITSSGWGIRNFGTLTIDNGTIESVEGAINFYGNSVTTINGGTYTATDNCVVMGNGNADQGKCTLTINGGTFNGGITSAGYIACGVYVPNSGTYAIKGGTFNITGGCGVCARAGTTKIDSAVEFTVTGTGKGWVGDKKAEVPAGVIAYFDWTIPPYPGYAAGDTIKAKTKYATAEGQVWSEEPDEDGYYTLSEPTVVYVAKIGDKKYETLPAAFDAAKGVKDVEIELLSDVKMTAKYVIADFNGTLNLGGFSVTNDESWVLSTYDWMFDTTEAEDGSNKMNIKNGTIYLDERMIYVRKGWEVTLAADATIISHATGKTANTVRIFGGTLNVYGTINLDADYEASAIIDVPIKNSIVNVYDGANLITDGGWGYKVGGDSTTYPELTVYGGTITINSTYPVFNCYSGNHAKIDIRGGTFKRDSLTGSLITLGGDKNMTVVPLTKTSCTAKFKNMNGVSNWCATGYAAHLGEDGYYFIDDAVAATGVTLDKETAELTLEDGKVVKTTLMATVAPTDADVKATVWASDATGVAVVTNGTVTAVAAGTANITVTITDYSGNTWSATCVVTVKSAGPVPASGSETKVDPVPGKDNTYEVKPTGTSTTVAVDGVKSGDTLVVDGSKVDSIGVNSAEGVTVKVMNKAGTVDISNCCKGWTGNTYDATLDGTKTVTVGTEEIPVTPTAIEAEASEGTIADGAVATKAIPGLTYTLKRGTELGTYGTTADSTVADTTTVSLKDTSSSKPTDKAFYVIEVTK